MKALAIKIPFEELKELPQAFAPVDLLKQKLINKKSINLDTHDLYIKFIGIGCKTDEYKEYVIEYEIKEKK